MYFWVSPKKSLSINCINLNLMILMIKPNHFHIIGENVRKQFRCGGFHVDFEITFANLSYVSLFGIQIRKGFRRPSTFIVTEAERIYDRFYDSRICRVPMKRKRSSLTDRSTCFRDPKSQQPEAVDSWS